MERKFKVCENGGVVVNKVVEEHVMKQKNYVIREENINKVKAWAKEFGIKSESEMLDEIILAFGDMLELGKKATTKDTKVVEDAEQETATTQEPAPKKETTKGRGRKSTKLDEEKTEEK